MGKTTAVILLSIAVFASCSGQTATEDVANTSSGDQDRIARAVNEFGYNLKLKMMKENVNDNIVISPTSVAGLLAMTLLGSVGPTYDEMAKALGFSQDILENRKNHEQFGDLLRLLNVDASGSEAVSKYNTIDHGDGSSLDVNSTTNDAGGDPPRTMYADAIVVDEQTRIRSIYRDYLERVYRGDVLAAHFGDGQKSLQLINDWVKNNTNGKIQDFLKEPVPVSTKVVLLSALYFSGQWEHPFHIEDTTKMTFYRPSGNVTAELMLNYGKFNYMINAQSGVHMLALPYNDNTTTMYVLKPFNKKRTTLAEALEALTYATIDEMISNMKMQSCIIRFPKMDLKTKVDLKDALRKLGVSSMFSPGDANFALMVDSAYPVVKRDNDEEVLTRIYNGDEKPKNFTTVVNNLPNPGVYVDSVLHDVKVTVDESGTVAVAATSGVLARTATMFYTDSPFYMFIRNERTKLVTFSAIINDPTLA